MEWLCRQNGFVQIHNAIAVLSTRVGVMYRRAFYKEAVTAKGRVRIQRHVLRVYASLYVFVFAVFVVWQGARLIVTPFVAEIKAASSPDKQEEIRDKINERLEEYDEDAPDWRKSDKIRAQINKIDFAKIGQSMLAEVGQKVFESAKNIVEIVVLPVLAFYFLIDGRKLKHEFVALAPRRYLRETVRMTNEFNRIMRAFVVGR